MRRSRTRLTLARKLEQETIGMCAPDRVFNTVATARLMEEMGLASTLRSFTERMARHVVAHGSADQRDEFEHIRLRSQSLAEDEARLGKGSLLKLDHPMVKRFAERGIIGAEELANAARLSGLG